MQTTHSLRERVDSGLTSEGVRLRDQRVIDGTGNDQCPICEDEDSFGQPCDSCVDAGFDL